MAKYGDNYGPHYQKRSAVVPTSVYKYILKAVHAQTILKAVLD